MAAQGAVKRASEKAETARLPRAPRDKKARVFDYSRWRLKLYSSDDFAAYLADYPDKKGLMAYVYRLLPKIDLTLVGIDQTNILETATPAEMTPQFVAAKFGRGKYMLKLNDANRPKGQTEVCQSWFRLEDEEKPPVYDIRTLVLGHADNIDEVNRQLAIGNLVRDAVTGAPRVRTQADADGPLPVVNGSNGGGELLTRETVGQLILGLVKNGTQHPGEMMKQSIEIAKLLNPPERVTTSVDQLQQLRQVIEITRMLQPPAAVIPPAISSIDPFQNYERIEAFISKVRGDAPIAAGGDGAGTLQAVAAIISGLTSAVPQIFEGIERLRKGPGRAGPVRRVQNVEMQKTLPDRVAEIAQLGFAKMNEGVNGFDFAAWVCAWHPGGLEVYRFLEPNGAAGVLGLAAMNPQTAPVVSNPATRAQLEQFLNDFFTFDPDGGQGAQMEESAESAEPLAAAS